MRHVTVVSKCMAALAGSPVLEEGVDVGIWRYRYYCERPYVANLCYLPAEALGSWHDRYMFPSDAIYLHRAIILIGFRYESWSQSLYWTQQLRWERCTLSVMSGFVPYHFICGYKLAETARDRFLVRIPFSVARLEVFHGFIFELEPIFSYMMHSFIRNIDIGLSVFAYIKRVVHMWTALLWVSYDECRLWYVPPDVIGIAHQLGMALEVPIAFRVPV